jgi:hypothetical protein
VGVGVGVVFGGTIAVNALPAVAPKRKSERVFPAAAAAAASASSSLSFASPTTKTPVKISMLLVLPVMPLTWVLT